MSALDLFYIFLVVASGLAALSGYLESDDRRYLSWIVTLVFAGVAVGAAAIAYGIYITGAL